MAGVWGKFRGLPMIVQVLGWIFLFPLIAPLAITKGQREPTARLITAAVVFVVAAPFWLAAYTGGGGDPAEDQTAPSADAVSEQSEESDQAAGEPEPITTDPEPGTEEPSPTATDEDTGDDTTDAQGGGMDTSSTKTPQLDQAPATPDVGSSQSRAPPEAETADGVLVSALLAELTVAPEQPAGYDRDLFPHWITRNGCTTRNQVLIDESNGTAVANSGCTVTTGQWYSHFDAVWVDVPRSLDIDHVVPLAEAWRSGARTWDETTRRAFANDLTDPRSLIAVTASSNRSKSDSDPADWLPSNTAYRCDYIGSWIAIKHRWELTIDSREQTAIQRVLDGCGELRTSPIAAAEPATAPSAPAPTPTPVPAPAPTPAPAPEPEPESPSGGLPIQVFANCGELNAVYPGGVARNGVTGDMVSGELRPFGKQPVFDDALYEANPRRDGDKDGIACEKR